MWQVEYIDVMNTRRWSRQMNTYEEAVSIGEAYIKLGAKIVRIGQNLF